MMPIWRFVLFIESVLRMQKLLMAAAAVEAPAKAITKFLFKCTNNQYVREKIKQSKCMFDIVYIDAFNKLLTTSTSTSAVP